MAQKNKKTGLTDREQLFVLEYMKDLNATQSAIRAWYSEKSAKEIWYENLTKPHIQEAISKQRDKMMDKVWIEWQFVIDWLAEIARKCTQKEPIKDFQKNDIGEVIEWEKFVRDPNTAKGALDSLGKYYKLFTDKIETTGKDGWPIQLEQSLEQTSLETLLQLARWK